MPRRVNCRRSGEGLFQNKLSIKKKKRLHFFPITITFQYSNVAQAAVVNVSVIYFPTDRDHIFHKYTTVPQQIKLHANADDQLLLSAVRSANQRKTL